MELQIGFIINHCWHVELTWSCVRCNFVTPLSTSLSIFTRRFVWKMMLIHFATYLQNFLHNFWILIVHKKGTFMCIFEPVEDVTALSTRYLTSVFSEHSCTDPYYRWHELQSDSTLSCNVLRIIIQVFNKNLCYSII